MSMLPNTIENESDIIIENESDSIQMYVFLSVLTPVSNIHNNNTKFAWKLNLLDRV